MGNLIYSQLVRSTGFGAGVQNRGQFVGLSLRGSVLFQELVSVSNCILEHPVDSRELEK